MYHKDQCFLNNHTDENTGTRLEGEGEGGWDFSSLAKPDPHMHGVWLGLFFSKCELVKL